MLDNRRTHRSTGVRGTAPAPAGARSRPSGVGRGPVGAGRRLHLTLSGALLAGLLAVALAACGSSATSATDSGATATIALKPGESPVGQQLYGKQRGGVLAVYQHEDFEHFDPGEAYFVEDYTITSATQRSLYSYLPDNASKLEPDVAEGAPVISDGGRTVTVHIKPHIFFSPPVNREVSSGDVAYAIDRGANPNVPNPYFSIYFGDLVGAEHAKGGPIPGIETPSKHTLVFHLTKPTASLLVGALSLPLSAPVPPELAKPLDAHSPTRYGSEYLVATGPYMVKSNSAGKFLGIGYQPGKSATLVRNPNWNPHTDFRPAYLNEIKINIGGEPAVIGKQVLEGEDVVQNDTPAQSIVKEAYEHHPRQITFTAGAGDYYASLNTASGPFKSLDLRKAVWAALDREAIVKARGGLLAGAPMTHFIYPTVAGYEQAGGAAGPKVDYNEHPEGDAAVAEKYMKLAGYPSGRYTGGETLQLVGATGEPEAAVAQIVDQALKNLGFKTHLTLVEKGVMYGKYCTVPAQKIDVCPNVGWVRDFADPQTVLDLAFNGTAIKPEGNSNWSQLNVPRVNAAIEKAELVVGEPARAQAWAKIDEELVEQAAAAPEVFASAPNIEGKRVAGVNQLWNTGTWDYDFTSLK
ncbi:MAG TPA: ABC transporter substrate-binding protein [Solirubrobacteraceae bacterium]|jgi:peptide/nickel transport system substrate-binding protein|nr:ABC transporter substrate-binding protein [Solirubrobacteraceae bacterium]